MEEAAKKPGANQQLGNGTLVYAQGAKVANLVILHSGQVDCREQPPGARERYLFTLEAPAILGARSLVSEAKLPFSLTTRGAAVISSYPMTKESLKKTIASKPNIGILVLRSLLSETSKLYGAFSAPAQLLAKLTRAMDALSIAYKRIQPDVFQDNEATESMGFEDPVLSQAKVIVRKYEANGQSPPEKLTDIFFATDHSDFTESKPSVQVDIDRDEFSFAKRFISLPPNILGAIAQKDPDLFFMMARKLIRMSNEILHEYNGVAAACDELAEALLSGDYSWVSKVSLQVDLFNQGVALTDGSELASLTRFLAKVASETQSTYERVWDIEPPAVDPEALQKVIAFDHEEEKIDEIEPTDEETAEESSSGLSEKGIAKKVFQYSELPSEKYQEYCELIKSLKSFKNPLDSDTDVRKVRRKLNNLFWELYETCALKFFASKEPLPVWLRIFFDYALLDETLLDPEQVDFIYGHSAANQHSKYPIHTAVEWMELIYNKKVPTSVNELGLTLFEILKQENRDAKWKRESDLPADVDTSEARLKFEIRNMIETNAKLTSGSILNHLAILSKYSITMSMERAFVTKEKLEEEIDYLLNIDFSAFHREVLYENEKVGINREFIQKQVIPNFILIPSAGSVFQFWQEKDSRDKASPGRLCCPALATADLKDMLLSAVGAFRWELCKTIMGPDWNNISQTSLTADYTDYIQFFRKNRDLSPEAKEKLATEFKRFRDDRSRFVHDYAIWVKYESEGTQRLNKVARKILAKHIPFAKPIREKLLKLPSYTDIINKSINVRRRKATELEPRYKKYRSMNNGILPDELEENYRFYNMQD